jgi:putative nucleotidyltransferase with HDIG domain
MFVDITPEIERRHMLEITSRVNQLMANARDESALVQGLCDLLVEWGGYALAWVGVGSDSVEGDVEPRWSAGETRYLHPGIVSASADSPRGRGPTGTAFRERVVRVANDFEHEPRYSPWRDRVRVFGLSSAIAIPLDVGVPTVLTVYDRHRSAFDDAAVQSFTEIAHSIELQSALLRSLAEIESALDGTFQALATMTEFRDPYTQGHQWRVAQLAQAIARRLHLEPSVVHRIYLGGTVHDIGKVVVPAEILNRPRGLTTLEFELIKEHCDVGAAVLSAASVPAEIVAVALQHHERLDGSGYPHGLSGDQITLPARIIAVADVIEAMTNHRPYRPAMGLDAAMDEIQAGRGTRFDADVVDACVAVYAEGFAMDEADHAA